MLSITLMNCDTPVGFTSPQPITSSDLVTIPDNYQGVYYCMSDSTLIKVDNRYIYSEYTSIAIVPTAYISKREDCKIIDDNLIFDDKRICKIEEQHNTGHISIVNIERDTLFYLGEAQRARLYKGHLILSSMIDENLWSIAVLEKDQYDGITYRAITEDSDLDNIQVITPMIAIDENEHNAADFKITPRQVEFDQLFDDPTIFVDCDYYSKVNLLLN